MKTPPPSLRDRIRAQLADLKMPGALEHLDAILAGLDGGTLAAPTAIESLLGAQIALRNNRRLEAAMRSSRLPAVKTLADFDFSFQPSVKREQIESLHTLGFVERHPSGLVLLRNPLVLANESSARVLDVVWIAVRIPRETERPCLATRAEVEGMSVDRARRLHGVLVEISRRSGPSFERTVRTDPGGSRSRSSEIPAPPSSACEPDPLGSGTASAAPSSPITQTFMAASPFVPSDRKL